MRVAPSIFRGRGSAKVDLRNARSAVATRVLHLHADTTAHADDHRLALHRFEPALVVLHEIGGDEIDLADKVRNHGGDIDERGPTLRHRLNPANRSLAISVDSD